MPTQIQIKRGSTTPSGLTVGEQAVNTSTNQIYVGGTGGTVWVGGVVTAGVDMGGGSALSATQIPTQSAVYNYARTNFVSSFNGATGAVGGVTTSVANTFTALQSFNSGISANGGTFSVQLNALNLKMLTQGGDEGGQIDFSLPATNTTLSSGVAIDIYQNRVRIFETGGTNRGAYIDLTSASTGVGSNLLGGGAVSSVSGSGNGISVSPTTGAVVVQNTGVHSFNGLTGAVGGVTTSVANTFTALQSFNSGVSAAGITLGSDIRLWKFSNGPALANELTTIGNGSQGTGSPDATNIVFGVCAGWNISPDSEFGSGTANTFLGYASGKATVSGFSNTGVGYATLIVNTASSNTAVGTSSMVANTTGSENTAVGLYSLSGNTSGSQNVAIGKDALLNSKVNSLVAVGHSSLKANTTGTVNTAVGTSSLTALTTGSNNTAVGNSSLSGITTASDNTAIGRATLQFLATAAANRNVAVGSQAGTYYGASLPLTSATGGIYIGYDARASAVSQTNEIVIGTEARGLGSNTAVIGATTQTAATIYGLVSATNGVSAGGVSTFNAGVTMTGRLDVGGVLDVVSGTTLESTLNVVGNARFAAGVTTSTLYVSGGSTFAAAINAPGIVSSWSVITADQTAEINKGYLTNKATVLGLTLPSSAAVGSMIRVSGMTTAGWKITQNASQVIHFGKTDTTVGTAGYLQSTLARDGVELVCCVANNEWNVVSSVGNITIV